MLSFSGRSLLLSKDPGQRCFCLRNKKTEVGLDVEGKRTAGVLGMISDQSSPHLDKIAYVTENNLSTMS